MAQGPERSFGKLRHPRNSNGEIQWNAAPKPELTEEGSRVQELRSHAEIGPIITRIDSIRSSQRAGLGSDSSWQDGKDLDTAITQINTRLEESGQDPLTEAEKNEILK